MQIRLIGTGGTIASRHTSAGVVAQLSARELLDSLGDRVPSGLEVTPVDVGVRPSFALRVEDMRDVACAAVSAARGSDDAVVVLHGTDSMEETSFLTDLLHDGPESIVFTGAQRANDALDGDAADNMVLAIDVARDAHAQGRGVLLAFHGEIWNARGVRKVHTQCLAGFADPNGKPVVFEGPATRKRSTFPGAYSAMVEAELPRVEVVAAVPGGDGKALLAAADHGARAVVLQALGIGNASPADAAAVATLVDQGIPVLVTSRVIGGPVLPVYGGGGGTDLERHGALFAGSLSPWQARILATVALTTSPESATDSMTQWLQSTQV